MSRLRHILWDWNGTLLDDVAACVCAINRMLRRRGLPEIGEALYRERFGFPVRNYYAALGFNLAAEDWDALAREFHAHYAETARGAPLRAGAAEALAALSARGVPMSVLSACEQSILERMLAERGLDGHFERVRGLSDLYAGSKRELGRRLLRELALPPEAVVLVGDTIHDHEVARALGCACVLLAGGHQAEERLRRCRRPLLRSLEQLPEVLFRG